MANLPIRASCVVLATTSLGYLIYKLFSSKYSKNTKSISKRIVIESVEDWNLNETEIIRVFRSSQVIGLDCEWVSESAKRSPVSLLQLSTDSGYCVLIRLCCLPIWLMPKGILYLLSNEQILKVGVAIYDDANKLFNDYGLEVRGFIDLRFLVRDLIEMQGKNLGLKSLSLELLGVEINKSKRLRCSNWEAEVLTDDQINYAAEDATISAKIFFEVKRRKTNLFSTILGNFNKEVQTFMDMQFKENYANTSNSANSRRFSPSKINKSRYSKARSKPMYDNCQLVAPDGEILCSCDKGKAEWYVSKGLGEVICNEPFKVQLNFEPSGRPTLDNVFYTMEKSNCCVVCGATENFHRKLVIPSEYRKFFPDLMKKNLSHDILLLCVNCHKRSNIIDQNMRLKLAELCDAPLGSRRNVKMKCNPELVHVRSAASALLHSGEKIPKHRKIVLEKILLDHFEVSSVDEDILVKAADVDINIPNDSYIPHGQKVYEYFSKNGGLIEFERMWRQHFLDTMQPQFLPEMWSIDHNHKRLAIQVLNHEREIDFDTTILGITPELLKQIKEERLVNDSDN